MKKRTKNIIVTLVIIQFIVILGLLTLPSVVQAIPGRYRVALSERNPALSNLAEGVIDAVAPEATALPTSSAVQIGSEVDISALISGDAVTIEPILPSPTATAEIALSTSDGEIKAAGVETPTLVPTSSPTPSPTNTPTPLPEKHILSGMGVIKQTFNNCGPANLTQTLNFLGNDITQDEVASYLKPNPEDRNVSAWQIADYVNEQTPGYNAIARSGGTLEMIKRFVAAGHPVVVEKGYDLPDSGWWGHYLTIYGYDDAKQEFNTQDSYLGPWDGSGRPASYSEMEKYWQQFNYTFYVVYQTEQENEVAAILGPDMFDDFTMWKNAAARAEAETKVNNDDAIAWFNLGTALTRMGGLTGESRYYEGGAQAFDRARQIGLPPRMLWYQFQPYLAYLKLQRYQDIVDLADATLATQGGRNVEETYWYKGHALAFLGEISAAREAYEEALRVNENFYPAQWSLDALQ